MRHQSSPKSFASSKDRLQSWHKQCVSRNTTCATPRVEGLLHHIGSAFACTSPLEYARTYTKYHFITSTRTLPPNTKDCMTRTQAFSCAIKPAPKSHCIIVKGRSNRRHGLTNTDKRIHQIFTKNTKTRRQVTWSNVFETNGTTLPLGRGVPTDSNH